MTKMIASTRERLDLREKIHAFVAQTEKCAALCYSPKRTEFEFLAFLAAWESTALHDSKAPHWFNIWQKHCREFHHGNTGRTLADPIRAIPLSERLRVTGLEEAKAYATVTDGLRRVFKATLSAYTSEMPTVASCGTGTDTSAVLVEKIRDSFTTAKSFATPEGLEIFLLTLIEFWEQSLGVAEDALISRKAWLAEIRRRRLGGSPQTRTLADVAPPDIRLERQNAFSERVRAEILRRMLSSMRKMTTELQAYLEKRLH